MLRCFGLHVTHSDHCDFLLPSELNLQNLSHLMDKVFLIFPNYCLGMSFSQFYQNYEFISFCTSSPLSEAICKYLSKFCSNLCLCHVRGTGERLISIWTRTSLHCNMFSATFLLYCGETKGPSRGGRVLRRSVPECLFVTP